MYGGVLNLMAWRKLCVKCAWSHVRAETIEHPANPVAELFRRTIISVSFALHALQQRTKEIHSVFFSESNIHIFWTENKSCKHLIHFTAWLFSHVNRLFLRLFRLYSPAYCCLLLLLDSEALGVFSRRSLFFIRLLFLYAGVCVSAFVLFTFLYRIKPKLPLLFIFIFHFHFVYFE